MKNTLVLLCLILLLSVYAHGTTEETKQHLKTWHISGPLAGADSIPPDTTYLNFPDKNPIDNFSIANSYNGNLGSPIQSKLYFDRPQSNDFIFSDAYYPYILQTGKVNFFNTKKPFSNISYYQGGSNFRKEENINFLFTANFGKRMNFGTTLDYIHAWGEYKDQSAKRFNGSLFGSLDGKRYKATGAVILNDMDNFENGGLADINYITNPSGVEPKDMPTKISAYSKYKYNSLFYNHQYSIGFDRTVKVNADSSYTEHVPVTRFSHTLQLDEAKKLYYEPSTVTGFYANTYFDKLTSTKDTAALQNISNTIAVHMEEEFNKWMRFGLTAYLQAETQLFTYNVDTLIEKSSFTNVKLGGILSKQRGRILRYNAQAEIGTLGYKAGNFLLKANAGSYFKIWKDSVILLAKGFMRSDVPSFFLQAYNSRHFRWQNSFGAIYRTQLSGQLAIPTRRSLFELSVENIHNYVYFDAQGIPQQFSGSIQVLSAKLKQDFRLGRFALENHVVYQLSSQQDMLPLPNWTLYHNIYYYDKWFKVLSVQMGANLRMHTAYYAPYYMPATGQFIVQNKTLIGNFPVLNLYLNFHLKQTRFFLQYYHFNQQFTKGGNYFSMPDYPLNPTIFKTGISWNFYD